MGPTSPTFRRGPVQPRKRLSGWQKEDIEKKHRGRFHDHDHDDTDRTATTVLMWMKQTATMTKPT